MNILVSACLLGVNCRYDGTSGFLNDLNIIKNKHNLIPVCPEIFGGLKTPRNPAEIINGRVMTKFEEDVTAEYVKGAKEILMLSKFYSCNCALLKAKSPSCGFGKIYNGTFSKTLKDGNGILAELLLENGFMIFTENTIDKLLNI